MALDSQFQDALDDNTPRLNLSSEVCIEYQSLARVTRYEPARTHIDLTQTILNALDRDDRSRWAYVRRRWQGLGDKPCPLDPASRPVHGFVSVDRISDSMEFGFSSDPSMQSARASARPISSRCK